MSQINYDTPEIQQFREQLKSKTEDICNLCHQFNIARSQTCLECPTKDIETFLSSVMAVRQYRADHKE